jgi:peroxiredoxin Q/BCP
LLSDRGGSLRRAYRAASLFGLVPGRVTFVIDKQGIVRHVSRSLFSAEHHITQSLDVVRRLVAESPKAATPEPP